MRIAWYRVCVIAFMAGMSGCATGLRDDLGPMEKVDILSMPAGASAITSTGVTCTTPCSARIRSTQILQVKLMKAGCLTESLMAPPRLRRGKGDFDPYAGSSYSHVPLNANLICDIGESPATAQSKNGEGETGALSAAAQSSQLAAQRTTP